MTAWRSAGECGLGSSPARWWRQVPATGFIPRTTTRREYGEACAGDTVGGVAAGNGLLVAVGAQAVDPEPGDEYCDARRRVWVSNDAATCTRCGAPTAWPHGTRLGLVVWRVETR